MGPIKLIKWLLNLLFRKLFLRKSVTIFLRELFLFKRSLAIWAVKTVHIFSIC